MISSYKRVVKLLDFFTPQGVSKNNFLIALQPGKVLKAEDTSVYMKMIDKSPYLVYLYNGNSIACDCDLKVDGVHCGTFRLNPKVGSFIERPLSQFAKFTFVKDANNNNAAVSVENLKPSLFQSGVVTATFTPFQTYYPSSAASNSMPSSRFKSGKMEVESMSSENNNNNNNNKNAKMEDVKYQPGKTTYTGSSKQHFMLAGAAVLNKEAAVTLTAYLVN